MKRFPLPPATLAARTVPALTAIGLALVSGCSTGEPTAEAIDEETRERALTVLREGLHSGEFWPAMHAAEALTLAGHGEEVAEFAVPLLASEQDDQRRCGLARELVRTGDTDKAKIMVGILEGEDPHGHVHAAESLYKVGGDGIVPSLRAAFDSSDDIRLRLMAAAALARHGGETDRADALAFLRDTLAEHPDPDIFRLAAWVLARVGAAEDIARIRARLPDAPENPARAFLEHALAALGDAEGRAALLRNLSSDDPAVRTYAAVFAGEAGMGDAIPALIGQLGDANLDAGIRAAQALLVLANQP